MCAGVKRFFGPRTWILSSMTLENLWNNRPFDAVINMFFNSFSRQKFQNLPKGNTLLNCPQFSSVFMESAPGYGANRPVQASEIIIISMLSSVRFSILLQTKFKTFSKRNTLPMQLSTVLNRFLGLRSWIQAQ